MVRCSFFPNRVDFIYYLCVVSSSFKKMQNKQPQHISFALFRDMVNQEDASLYDVKPFIGHGFAVVRNVVQILRSIVAQGIPIRLDDMRCGCVTRGWADVLINLQPYYVAEGALMFIGAGSIIQVNRFSDDFNLMGLTVTNDLLNVWMHGQVPVVMQSKMTQIQLYPTVDERNFFVSLFDLLWAAVHQTDSESPLTGYLIGALIHTYERLYLKYSKEEACRPSHEREVFESFIRLVNASNGVERRLDYYAAQLHLTPRYLGTIVKQVSDVTAKEWIDRAAIMQIKVLLKHSDKQITQISDQLRFANDSFFCKYFKRLTGLTPNEYRSGQ